MKHPAIEKGIPFPAIQVWDQFELWDSMKVQNYGAAANANKWARSKKLDWHFKVRKVNGELRIWRVQ